VAYQVRAAETGEQGGDVVFVDLPPHALRGRAVAVTAPVDHDQAELVGQVTLTAEGVHAPASRAVD
jgi:hypothetical protein